MFEAAAGVEAEAFDGEDDCDMAASRTRRTTMASLRTAFRQFSTPIQPRTMDEQPE